MKSVSRTTMALDFLLVPVKKNGFAVTSGRVIRQALFSCSTPNIILAACSWILVVIDRCLFSYVIEGAGRIGNCLRQ